MTIQIAKSPQQSHFFLDTWQLSRLSSKLVLWFEENIVTDLKKAPGLAQILLRVSKTN